MLLVDNRAVGEEDSSLGAPRAEGFGSTRPEISPLAESGEFGEFEKDEPRVSDRPSAWVRVRGCSRLVAKLGTFALVFTIVITALPFGKPDGSSEIIVGGQSALRADRPTTTQPGATSSTMIARTAVPLSERFTIDAVAIAPAAAQVMALLEADAAAPVEPGEWVEPEIESEGEWVNGGNGVRLPDVLLRIRFCESSNDYRAANGSSSARGAYQFLTMSWNYYGHAARTGAAEAHLATPAQQDEAALATYREVGARPWAESRACWDDDNIDPRYLTARPSTRAPTTTTTAAPGATTSTTAPDGTSSSTTAPTTTTTAPTTTTPITAPSTSTTAPSTSSTTAT